MSFSVFAQKINFSRAGHYTHLFLYSESTREPLVPTRLYYLPVFRKAKLQSLVLLINYFSTNQGQMVINFVLLMQYNIVRSVFEEKKLLSSK